MNRARMRGPGPWLAAALAGCLVFGHAASVWGQEAPGSTDPAQPATAEPAATEEIRQRIAQIDEERRRLETVAEEWAAKAANLEKAQVEVPAVVAETEAEIARLKARDPAVVDAAGSLAELETDLLSAEQDLALARSRSAEIDKERASRVERRRA